MSDKVQKIRQEIERKIEICEKYSHLNLTESTSIGNHAQLLELREIKDFIDSLPKEPASEDLEEEIKNYFSDWLIDLNNHKGFLLQIARHFAEWGRNHFEDKSEMVSGDLKEAAQRYCQEKNYMQPLDKEPSLETLTAIDAFIKGAEWQKQKDQETIELAEDHAMLAGMNKMKEEMMKDAVEAEVFIDYNINFGYGSLTANIDLDEQQLKEGDKVKIIIVKEEQQ